jgi:putative endonuclease
MVYFVYILYSAGLQKHYVGYTGGSVEERLKKHNVKHRGFTGRNADWVIMYTEIFKTKAEAINRESEIKAWKSRIKIEQLIDKRNSIK